MNTETRTIGQHVTVTSGRAFTGSSQWGYEAYVDADGHVRVFDDVAGDWTSRHALTPRQIAYVLRLASARA